MKRDGKRRLKMNKLTIHFDMIARDRLRTEIGARPTIDRNTPRRDQLITMSPRTYAGRSEETVEAHI